MNIKHLDRTPPKEPSTYVVNWSTRNGTSGTRRYQTRDLAWEKFMALGRQPYVRGVSLRCVYDR